MTITVTEPATVSTDRQHADLDLAARMLPHIPKFGGSGWLSTDLLAGDNVSHSRTSVRSEGR